MSDTEELIQTNGGGTQRRFKMLGNTAITVYPYKLNRTRRDVQTGLYNWNVNKAKLGNQCATEQ